ncbi:MAG: methyltransferase [Blastochloris viridis]|uniref:Methyltransferase n=1 Tax=Blastochloris viridis TaxID=1079 RepID=A0A6N4R9D7_BLAVI|nr:MAG: methyltransferase [Blastochloris viridis]
MTVTTFTTLGGRLVLEDTAPRPTEDPLWLTAFVPPLPQGARVLDCGTGSGIAALSLLRRQPHVVAEALDIDPALTALAQRNAHLNALPLVTHTANILSTPVLGPYDAILCNPPYHEESRGHTTPNPAKKQAHSLPEGDLTRWLTALIHLLTPTGTLHLILHTACEAELTAFAQENQKILHLTPLQTAANKPPKRLLALLENTGPHQLHRHNPIPAYNAETRHKFLT